MDIRFKIDNKIVVITDIYDKSKSDFQIPQINSYIKFSSEGLEATNNKYHNKLYKVVNVYTEYAQSYFNNNIQENIVIIQLEKINKSLETVFRNKKTE